MNAHKVLLVLAAIGLAVGLAGCSSSEPKAASEPAHKIPTAVQMSQEKQAEIIERNVKDAKDYVAKVKAEKEAEAAAAQTQAQAGAQAQGSTQSQARSGGNYQGRSNYQAPRRSGGNYQAPRSGANSGGGGNSGGGWSNGSVDTKDGKYWYVKDGVDEVHVCGDSEGNTWLC